MIPNDKKGFTRIEESDDESITLPEVVTKE